jgi:hypothetical protein
VAGNPARIIRYRKPREQLTVGPEPYPGSEIYREVLPDDRVMRSGERVARPQLVPTPETPSAN